MIDEILNVVKACGRNAIFKYDSKGDKSVIWKIDGKNILPKDFVF